MPPVTPLATLGRRFAPRPLVVRHALRTALAALAAESVAAGVGLPQA